MNQTKTLVGVGCSHVFGEYMGDIDPVTCHQRSWVKKLEKLGNFKTSVNLGIGGGSNIRSERVLFEYLKNNDTENLVVIFSITELSRTEFVDAGNSDFFKIGSWMGNKDVSMNSPQRVKEFVETYYGKFHTDTHDIKEINRRMLMIHLLLKSLNIEHYFFEMLNVPGTVEESQFGFQLPLIPFQHKDGTKLNANGFLTYNNQLPGECHHWDHEGNEFLANHLLEQIKGLKNE